MARALVGEIKKLPDEFAATLRVEARERTDPLTGLAMPRVFFDRVDGALIRSRNMGYASALVFAREGTDVVATARRADRLAAQVQRDVAGVCRPREGGPASCSGTAH